MKSATRSPKQQADKKSGRMKSNAAGQYLGYSLQITQMLSLLLQGDLDSVVSLEVFEDVGAESKSGKTLARQVKSTSGVRNPISNRSVDLWKTFSNWVEAIQAGFLDVDKTIFELFVSSPKDGAIANKFSECTNVEDAKRALLEAKDILKATAPKKATFPKEIEVEGYIDTFLKCPEETLLKLIASFKLRFGSGRSINDVSALQAWKFVPEEIVKVVVEYALGWVKKKVDECIEKKMPARISVQEFRTEIIAFIRVHDRRTILASFAAQPSAGEIKSDLLKTYVRQLDLIEADDDTKIQAVIDYLKSSNDRIDWSLKGYINKKSLDDLEESLIRTWRTIKDRTSLTHAEKTDVEKGKLLYLDCSIHKSKLAGMETPEHFTSGSFHAISDKEAIGWHSNYRALLNAKEIKK